MLLVALLGTVAACASTEAVDQSTRPRPPPLIVVSTALLADTMAEMTGRAVAVESLIPAGVDPLTAEPTGDDLTRLRTADLIVRFGLGHEPNFDPLFAAAADNGAEIIELGPLLDPRPTVGGSPTGPQRADDGEDGADLDPAVWLDPVRMIEGLTVVAERMTQLRAELAGAEMDEARATYVDALIAVDQNIIESLEPFGTEGPPLRSAGASLTYLADRYDFEVTSADTPADDSPVFADAADERLAQIARRIPGVELLHTRNLAPTGDPADTYVGLLLTNRDTIVAALERTSSGDDG